MINSTVTFCVRKKRFIRVVNDVAPLCFYFLKLTDADTEKNFLLILVS